MKLIPLFFLSLGVMLLMQIVMPLASFKVWEFGQKLNSQNLFSPLKSNEQVLGISVQNKDNFSSFVSNLKRDSRPSYSQFSISIPRLNLKNQVVEVDSNDLSKGLIQLPGSALPGEKGNLFISGHSAVSPLFSFKAAPFAKLTDFKKGDIIEVSAGGTNFTYQVVGIKVVDPSDLSVIPAPDEIGRYISLMTCVPPGLNFKRLVVLGKMM